MAKVVMYEMDVETNSGYTKSIKVISEELLKTLYKLIKEAQDLGHIDVIDGLTGEVIWSYSKGIERVFNTEYYKDIWC